MYPSPSAWVFEAKDPNGNTVRLSRSTFERHLPVHPEIEYYADEAKRTIEDPDEIIRDSDGCYHYYRFGLGRGKFQHCWVEVLVYYRRLPLLGTVGRIASYWLTRKPGKGEVIWKRG